MKGDCRAFSLPGMGGDAEEQGVTVPSAEQRQSPGTTDAPLGERDILG